MMKKRSADKILSEMEEVLDQLIQNAEKLYDVSRQVIAEEELAPLQNRQQELLSTLLQLDDAFHKANMQTKEDNSSVRSRIQEKIEIFQRINSSFVTNITTSYGLIQFESDKTKKPRKQLKEDKFTAGA